MPARFAETINALKKGVTHMTVNAAVKNIESWEASLSEVDEAGAKGVVRDLEALKKALHKDEPDGAAVRKLLAKLGKETTGMAKKLDGAAAERLAEMGDLLAGVADGHDDEEKATEKKTEKK